MPRKIEKATPERTARWKKALAEVEQEKSELIAAGRKLMAEHRKESREIAEIFQQLRTKREAQGLSLQDISDRTGMTRESISRLENLAGVNATFATAQRYAQALGLEIHCTLLPSS
jgi:AraC-like DNA-binding protein